MKRVAIFSDIHANWEALETAGQHAETRNIDTYVILGDTLGYGVNPNECMEWVYNRARVHTLGNQERALLHPNARKWFSPFDHEACLWTDKELAEDLRSRLAVLSPLVIINKLSFAHASIYQPERYQYIHSIEDAYPSFDFMQTKIAFVGHTHIPCCFQENTSMLTYLKPGVIPLTDRDCYILNPGSVGQPRDKDTRLSYGIFDRDEMTFEIVRLPYDNKKAARKIKKAGLSNYLADRLL